MTIVWTMPRLNEPARAGENAATVAGQPSMTRGINLTNWFRYPGSTDPAALALYLSDRALSDLRAVGFDFVRLAIDPDLPALVPTELGAIRRLQRAGFSVIVSPHPHDWHLETDPAPLRRFWQAMAPRLRGLDPARTVPEIVNEPVFPGDPAGWVALQHLVLEDIRAVLPSVTVVLTGQDWGSVGGLLALKPEADPNVLYSFHFYDPAELTSLAAWLPSADRVAFARLPFPAGPPALCRDQAGASVDAPSARLIGAYCDWHWDAERLAEPIRRAAEWAHRNGVRLIAGEFGATTQLNRSARLAWIAAARSAFAADDIPWALWGYDDIMGFAVPRPPPRVPRLDPALLAALGLKTEK
ncbi:MAG TPA: cellulase family glycosylhydrolase [Rhodopila sp.]|nr:cellulase family glycosylhydrolase [Rhodopila sp.]